MTDPLSKSKSKAFPILAMPVLRGGEEAELLLILALDTIWG
jgi:hypothetical protein